MPYSPRKVSFLERECLREANRALRSSNSLSREQFLHLQIQTNSPFERIVLVLCGLAVGGGALWLFFAQDTLLGSGIFAAIALLIIIIGALGRRKTVESVFQGLDPAVSSAIFEALF